MKKIIIGVFVLLTFITTGFSQAQATALPLMQYYPNPVISGVSGPQTLKVGQMGTWRISAYDQEQSYLSYSVNWGEPIMVYSMGLNSTSIKPVPQQQSSFSHVYRNAGTYTVTFTVTNGYGKSTDTSLTVDIKGEEIRTSVKVTSPNGGEKIVIGQNYLITWNSTGLDSNENVSISLVDDSIKCPIGVVGCWSVFGIDGGFKENTGSYWWHTNENMFGDGGPNSKPIKPGTKYKIKVCVNDICDDSNGYFKIISPVVTNPVISGISGPQTLKVNQTGTWKVKAYSNERGNLSYFVDWGDTRIPIVAYNSLTAKLVPQQTTTFSHTYSRPGNYTVRFTVTDDSGQSVSKTLKVRVKDNNIKLNNF
ncbi:MAG: PKD domain-containing protein [Candidatus Paceibacterota bacterium]